MGESSESSHGSGSVRKEISLLFSLIGGALCLVGLIATDWAKPVQGAAWTGSAVDEMGLWRICVWITPGDSTKYDCYNINDLDVTPPGWFRVTQTLCVIGFILVILSLILTILSECVPRCRHNTTLVFAFISTGFASAVFLFPALAIFYQEVHATPLDFLHRPQENLQVMVTSLPSVNVTSAPPREYRPAWAYYLMLVSAVLQPVAALLGVCDAVAQCKSSKKDDDAETDQEKSPLMARKPKGSVGV